MNDTHVCITHLDTHTHTNIYFPSHVSTAISPTTTTTASPNHPATQPPTSKSSMAREYLKPVPYCCGFAWGDFLFAILLRETGKVFSNLLKKKRSEIPNGKIREVDVEHTQDIVVRDIRRPQVDHHDDTQEQESKKMLFMYLINSHAVRLASSICRWYAHRTPLSLPPLSPSPPPSSSSMQVHADICPRSWGPRRAPSSW